MKSKLSDISYEILSTFININRGFIEAAANPYIFIRHRVDNIENIETFKKYYQTVANLKRREYLRSIKNKKSYYALTKKGKLEAEKILIKEKIKKMKWDKKWRILIFDIPEKKRTFINNIRRTLIDIGFYQLQQSVWVIPYDIKDYLYSLIPGFREGDWFEYIEASRISSEEELKNHFLVD